MTDLLNSLNKLPQIDQTDLSVPHNRKALARTILENIDNYCAKTYDSGHRDHLGASMIGDVCSRKLWYVFRWAKRERFDGRRQRLFNRGHKEEARFIEWLRGVGFIIEAEENGKQYRITSEFGHFGGSLDGFATAGNIKLLLEFKTSGTGSGFTKLREDGVKKSKPNHFAQMSIYGKNYKFQYAIYCCINKNDDDLYIEVVELDWRLAEQLEAKAHDIITSPITPPKFSYSEATFECKYCNFAGICHRNEPVEKNCRSCVFACPIQGGLWACNKYNQTIPKDFISKGCDSYEAIK